VGRWACGKSPSPTCSGRECGVIAKIKLRVDHLRARGQDRSRHQSVSRRGRSHLAIPDGAAGRPGSHMASTRAASSACNRVGRLPTSPDPNLGVRPPVQTRLAPVRRCRLGPDQQLDPLLNVGGSCLRVPSLSPRKTLTTGSCGQRASACFCPHARLVMNSRWAGHGPVSSGKERGTECDQRSPILSLGAARRRPRGGGSDPAARGWADTAAGQPRAWDSRAAGPGW
jgi:hypothetical protein